MNHSLVGCSTALTMGKGDLKITDITMFDALLRSKFYLKCKSSMKITNSRLEMIKRKRNAMQNYLKKDIADLLKNGLDVNAYGRAEGFLFELNLSACYNFVEQFCGCISNHLPAMDKQRRCPEECREAVPSLMFAAARFADLPELRDLRSIFAARYGNSLDAYVNQEFVEKLKAVPPTKETKLQLLQDIALESGTRRDFRPLQQKLYNPDPPASEQAWSKNTDDDKHKLQKRRDGSVPKTENRVINNKLHDERYTPPERKKEDVPFLVRRNAGDETHMANENNAVHGGDLATLPIKGTRVSKFTRTEHRNKSSSEGSVPEEEAQEQKPFHYRFVSPPYTKPKAGESETGLEISSVGPGSEGTATIKVKGHVDEEDNRHQDYSLGETKPKPRSVRRRRSKPPPGSDNIGNNEGDKNLTSNGSRLEAAKLDLNIANQDYCDQKDEEERMMDSLLMHYSKKQPPYKVGKVEAATIDGNNAAKKTTKDGPPARAASLPLEPTNPTETNKGAIRASSFQPDRGHVHPNLPDYDDFVARLAALRGK
ncbi:uncharacterized protein LOC127793968 [Diospyros lotus]|uniref:uncharacterized protein LOC127793968 n=1 Tax=Diospyros lotus TaxID=55363 RepID=UPI002251F837|nr:uncharacterized protein LOC127793968 [Diospyros lotus]